MKAFVLVLVVVLVVSVALVGSPFSAESVARFLFLALSLVDKRVSGSFASFSLVDVRSHGVVR